MAYSVGGGVNDERDLEPGTKLVHSNRVYRNELSVARSRYVMMRMRKAEQEEKVAKSGKKKVVEINQNLIIN